MMDMLLDPLGLEPGYGLCVRTHTTVKKCKGFTSNRPQDPQPGPGPGPRWPPGPQRARTPPGGGLSRDLAPRALREPCDTAAQP